MGGVRPQQPGKLLSPLAAGRTGLFGNTAAVALLLASRDTAGKIVQTPRDRGHYWDTNETGVGGDPPSRRRACAWTLDAVYG